MNRAFVKKCVRNIGLILVLDLLTGQVIVSSTQAKTPSPNTETATTTKACAIAAAATLPLSFEANQGQAEKKIDFLARGNGYQVFLMPTEAVLTLHSPGDKGFLGNQSTDQKSRVVNNMTGGTLRMQLQGANAKAIAEGLGRLPGKINYLIGNDPKKWRQNIATYVKVKYEEVYPGIDLIYYGNQGQLEYDFVVSPEAEPKAIRLEFSGASKIEIDAHGNLVLQAQDDEILFKKPVIYQIINSVKRPIVGNYMPIGKNEVTFQVASYDANWPLVIDPVLVYSSYLGGSDTDRGHAIAVDSSGDVYLTGVTRSIDFLIENPLQANFAGPSLASPPSCCNFVGDAFVTKISTSLSGSQLVYSTYLGGNNWDQGFGIRR